MEVGKHQIYVHEWTPSTLRISSFFTWCRKVEKRKKSGGKEGKVLERSQKCEKPQSDKQGQPLENIRFTPQYRCIRDASSSSALLHAGPGLWSISASCPSPGIRTHVCPSQPEELVKGSSDIQNGWHSLSEGGPDDQPNRLATGPRSTVAEWVLAGSFILGAGTKHRAHFGSGHHFQGSLHLT